MARPLPSPAAGVEGLALRTPTLPPATHTNCWLLRADGGAAGDAAWIAVDPASREAGERRALAERLAGRRLRAVVLTHHHPDHVGGAEALRAATGAPVLAHPETARRLTFAVDGTLDEGDRLGDWRVLHTPGHAPGHLCLAREDGTVVAGDMVAGVGTILVEPPEGRLGPYLASLARLRGLAARLLPAHGPAIADGPAWIDALIAHRHARAEAIRAALARGPATPAAIVPGVYADVDPAAWPLAERQVLGHLLHLVEAGEVVEEAGVFRLTARTPARTQEPSDEP